LRCTHRPSIEMQVIPDGFYLMGCTDTPQPEWHKAMIDKVREVTHIAPADANDQILGCESPRTMIFSLVFVPSLSWQSTACRRNLKRQGRVPQDSDCAGGCRGVKSGRQGERPHEREICDHHRGLSGQQIEARDGGACAPPPPSNRHFWCTHATGRFYPDRLRTAAMLTGKRDCGMV
jgi:hypothetical protein